jgi:hypothetical protein
VSNSRKAFESFESDSLTAFCALESVAIWVIRAAGAASNEAIEASLKVITPDVTPKASRDAAKPEPIINPLLFFIISGG